LFPGFLLRGRENLFRRRYADMQFHSWALIIAPEILSVTLGGELLEIKAEGRLWKRNFYSVFSRL